MNTITCDYCGKPATTNAKLIGFKSSSAEIYVPTFINRDICEECFNDADKLLSEKKTKETK